MDFVVVAVCALLASGLTMYSGFGLGTLLLPVFALFFPVELAVAATAAVHGANSLLKAVMLGKLADRKIVLLFGIPAIFTALAGAYLLGAVSALSPWLSYGLFGQHFVITPIKSLMALLMMLFAIVELHPRFEQLEIDRKYLPLGGLLSGFFGGLSGHQGALRSAFLAKVGISAKAFVGTNAVIGLLVDLSRLSMYGALLGSGVFASLLGPRETWLIVVGGLAAFAGVVAGKRLLSKVTMRSVQRLTGVMLLCIAVLLGAGLI